MMATSNNGATATKRVRLSPCSGNKRSTKYHWIYNPSPLHLVMVFLGGILLGTQMTATRNELASGVAQEQVSQQFAMIDSSFSSSSSTRSANIPNKAPAATSKGVSGRSTKGKAKITATSKQNGQTPPSKTVSVADVEAARKGVFNGNKNMSSVVNNQNNASPTGTEDEESIHDMLRRPPRKDLNFPKTNGTISACMLAMDDSIRLAEWIAYHYTTLPLGSLTIAIDPDSQSQERVLEVLDLWKNRIDIVAYTKDSEWLHYKFDEGWGRRIRREDGTLAEWFVTKKGPVWRSQSHKRRQNTFILHCMRRYKAQLNQKMSYWSGKRQGEAKWVLMTDSDEFLTYNYIHADEEDETNYEVKRGTTKEMIDKGRREAISYRYKIPPKGSRVTVADWLAVEQENTMCWKFPGLKMSSYESTNEARDALVPEGINAEQLMTLRFRRSGVRAGNFSKTLLDVGWGLMGKYGKDDVQNIHNPHKRICGVNGHSGSNADYLSSVFRINHYSSGSLEAYVERGNDRRANHEKVSFERFQTRNEIHPKHQDDDIRPWIQWFVDKVGIVEARRLLVNPLKSAYEDFRKHPFVMANKDKLRIADS